jgi:NhaC family Na+:H+ antiporter
MLSAGFASLIALKNGYTRRRSPTPPWRRHDGGVGDLHPARGRRPDRHVEHGGHDPDGRRLGVRLLNPSVFFLATAAICAIVGMVSGSSWTTAGTLGVAFVGCRA